MAIIPDYPAPARLLTGEEQVAAWQDGQQIAVPAAAIAGLSTDLAIEAALPLVAQAAAAVTTAVSALAGSATNAAAAQQAAIDVAAIQQAVMQAVDGLPLGTQLPLQATSRALLAAVSLGSLTDGLQVYLSEARHEGVFRWTTGNQSARITADPLKALSVAPTEAPTGASGAWLRVVTDRTYQGTWWGMIGDGKDDKTGTDNAAPMEAALNAIFALRGGTLLLAAGQYNITRAPTTITGGSRPSQVFLPAGNLPAGETTQYAITIMGAARPGYYTAEPAGMTIIHSTLEGNTGAACWGSKSISSHENGAIATYYFENLVLKGVTNPGTTMIDARHLPNTDFKRILCTKAAIDQAGGIYAEPTHENVAPVIGPQNDTPVWNKYDDFYSHGWNIGLQPGELFRIANINIAHAKWALRILENRHPGKIESSVITSVANGIKVEGPCEVDIWWDTEHASKPNWNPGGDGFDGFDVYDPNGFLRGTMRIHCHDGRPINVLSKYLDWTTYRPAPGSQFGLPFPQLFDMTDAKSFRELTANGEKQAVHSDLVFFPTPVPGQVASQRLLSNTAIGGTDVFVTAAEVFYFDGDLDRMGYRLQLRRDNMISTVLEFDSQGHCLKPFLGLHSYASKAAAAAAGIIPGMEYLLNDSDAIQYMR